MFKYICMTCGFEYDKDLLICPVCQSKSFILMSRKPTCYDCVYHTLLRVNNYEYDYCTLMDIYIRPSRLVCGKFLRKPTSRNYNCKI